MRPARDPSSVRPGILVIAAALLGISLFTMSVVVRDALGWDEPEGGDATASADHAREQGGRRLVLGADRDPDEDGFADSQLTDDHESYVREQWQEWSEERIGIGEVETIGIVDPQMSRFQESFDREAELPFRPTGRRGRIVSARGLDLPPDASCDVRVLPVANSGFNCLIRVMCGGRVVYPDGPQQAGYVSCELDGSTPRRAVDGMPTMRDGDPAVALDLERGTLTVGDRDHESSLYDLTIALDSTPVRVL